MADDKTLNIIIKLKDQATKGIKSLTGAFQKFALTPFKKVTGLITGLGKSLFSLPGLIAGGAIGALGKEIIDITAKFEQWEIAFTTLTGSASNARRLLEDIKTFAAKTPFELPGLVDSSKQLLAFGFAQEEIIDTMRRLGDISAGVGTDKLPTLVSALGKIRTKGKASLEELNMMLEAGVPILDELAAGFNISKEELFKMITAGKIGFEDVNDALTRLTDDGAMFGGLMEAQSQSLGGTFSNIKDNMTQAALAIGNEMLPMLKSMATSIKNFTAKDLTKMIKKFRGVVVDMVQGILNVKKEFNIFVIKTKGWFTSLDNHAVLVWHNIKLKFIEMINGMTSKIPLIGKKMRISTDAAEQAVKDSKREILKDTGDQFKQISDIHTQYVADHAKWEEQRKTTTEQINDDIEKLNSDLASKNEQTLKDSLQTQETDLRSFLDNVESEVDLSAEKQKGTWQSIANQANHQADKVKDGWTSKMANLAANIKAFMADPVMGFLNAIMEKAKDVLGALDQILTGTDRGAQAKSFVTSAKYADTKLKRQVERGQIGSEEAAKRRVEIEEDLIFDLKKLKEKAIEDTKVRLSDTLDPIGAAARIATGNAAWGEIDIMLGEARARLESAKAVARFNNGGVIPKNNGTIGDKTAVPMARFNGGELVSNQMEQANILHHMSKNRGATLPPNLGNGSNGNASQRIELHVDGKKLAETVVNNYNRASNLKLISRLRV